MPANLVSTLASLGVPGQLVAYLGAAVTIATVLVKVLPTPAAADTGLYPAIWRAISWAAHLGRPVTPGATP